MNVVYAVISYDTNTDQELNIVGWSANETEVRGLESQMNDLTEYLTELVTNNASATPLVEYRTATVLLYGHTPEYQPYGDFDALIRDGIFFAIVPVGKAAEHYSLSPHIDVVHCTNILKGLDNYLS